MNLIQVLKSWTVVKLIINQHSRKVCFGPTLSGASEYKSQTSRVNTHLQVWWDVDSKIQVILTFMMSQW